MLWLHLEGAKSFLTETTPCNKTGFERFNSGKPFEPLFSLLFCSFLSYLLLRAGVPAAVGMFALAKST